MPENVIIFEGEELNFKTIVGLKLSKAKIETPQIVQASTDIENAILTFHEAYASSASELVTEIVEYASKEVTLNQIEAESLYAGIMMDTKNF